MPTTLAAAELGAIRRPDKLADALGAATPPAPLETVGELVSGCDTVHEQCGHQVCHDPDLGERDGLNPFRRPLGVKRPCAFPV